MSNVNRGARRLGQHWMINRGALRTIVGALDLESDDIIIEIGPGKGALTDELRAGNPRAKIIAIEKDAKLIQHLQEKYAADKNTTCVQGNVLTVLPQLLEDNKQTPASYKLVGNIPYYITGKLMRLITELTNPPERAIFTIQREVAERTAAVPPRMNLLAAAIQNAAHVTVIKHLAPGSFYPAPKVTSSIIKLTDIKPYYKKTTSYYRFIRCAFAQPRKQLAGNLKKVYGPEKIMSALQALNLPNDIRAHNLSVKQLQELSGLLGP